MITPNLYHESLFKASGHFFQYNAGMYNMDIEGEKWFLKPMNCPGHCVVFKHRVRSYKELPLRMASFGVLHRYYGCFFRLADAGQHTSAS